MKKLKTKILVGSFVIAPIFSSCYLTKQGYRQLELVSSREPVEHLLCEDQLSDDEREKLGLSMKALKFAAQQGLNAEDSYKHYIKVKGTAVSYTVQAAKPTEMKLKHWWFPIVGSVPYLGFFDVADRDKEADGLVKEGFEVHKGGVAAFSSLGWFSDPIYSSMLNRSDVELAHLYFHELTHRTLWLKSGVEFNENLAEFVADELTKQFFTSLKRQSELSEFDIEKGDYANFKSWLAKLRGQLQEYFATNRDRPTQELIAEKERIIALAISQKPDFKRIDFVGKNPWNNARIMAAGLYSPDTSKFEKAARCFRSPEGALQLSNFLKSLEKKAEKSDDGFVALEQICEN